ncbi:hypothetical protein [uncultured Mediterranean phage uvMED]|nr:hypothetical protein [uncultured Mediterranean phage uvMED]
MAQVDIGKIKIVWKGAWNSSTAYTVDDAVSHSGSSYICIQAGTNQNPSSATSYWQVMATAGTNGTNGTDVGTTITTQGDILYRDGSGLQRLAAGTSGQVLQTGGTGANPSWGTVSSDFVKLATQELDSTGLSAVEFQNCFSATTDSTYGAMYLRLDCQKTGSSTSGLEMQFLTGTNTALNTASYHTFGGVEGYITTSHSTNQVGPSSDGNGRDAFPIDGWGFVDGNDNSEGNSVILEFGSHIYANNSRSRNFFYRTSSRDYSSPNYITHKTVAGRLNYSGTVTGLKIFLDNDEMHNGAITLWGMKK